MRLLLVEDDLIIASFIIKGLKEAGFSVDHSANGKEGLHMALMESYDIAIIDIMLPELDGLALIQEMRRHKKITPVIILSAKRSVDDRIKGLELGGDDYLTKPFAFGELLARIHSLMRRTQVSDKLTSFTFGDLHMNLLKREVSRGGRVIDLQPREFNLLEYLMRNKDRIISKTMILDHLYDYQFVPQTNVVDVLVCRLRNKVDRDFPEKIIHTVRGVGYALKKAE